MINHKYRGNNVVPMIKDCGTVLVTGGAGFIGSHIVDRLLSEGCVVRIIDNFSSGSIDNIRHVLHNGSIETIKGDLKNVNDALKAVDGVTTVFHFAANPEVRVSSIDPSIHFENNVVATFNVLEAMRRHDVKEIIFASSSSVYGEPSEFIVSEDVPMRPVSVYGASKAAGENLIHAYVRLYGFKAVILRYANVVGPRLRHGVVHDLVMKLKRDPTRLEVLGDGNQVRSFIYIDDAVTATVMAWRKSTQDVNIYNVGNEDWLTVNDVAKIVISTMGLGDVKIQYRPIGHGVGWLGDVKRIVLDISRLKSLGFKPTLNSKEAVRRAVLSYL
jgi:UDP-glucose 4-epimerase